jgi:RNA-directed DNA polymerase
MSGDVHVRICERLGVKLPWATRLICHCRSEEQARNLNASLEQRFAECGLTLHPEKTKIVYCKDDDRRGTYRDQKYDFLGYTFRPRLSRRWHGFGVVFSPAASDKSLQRHRRRSQQWLERIARRQPDLFAHWCLL